MLTKLRSGSWDSPLPHRVKASEAAQNSPLPRNFDTTQLI
jgi:hypothetical protein